MEKEISIKKAALINAGARYTTVVLQIFYMAVLSRILTPADYGTVAAINVFVVFFQLLADMGFSSGVIQNRTLEKKEIDDIFSLTVYIGLGLMIVFTGFSYLISLFYDDAIYISLGVMLSVGICFTSVNMIPNAVMLRQKRFIAIGIRTVVVALFSSVVTVLIALAGWGVYSLVIYSIINSVTIFLWNEISTKLRFNFKPGTKAVKKIWGYSMYQFGAQILNYFNRNTDNLLIGKFMGKIPLGYYNKAYTLMQYPITYFPGVITPVLHPILSEHQEDKEYIFNIYINLLKFLSLLGCFGSAFCFFASREIILIAFGDQWVEAIVPFSILALSLWPQILINTIGPIYLSIGNTKLMFKNIIISTLIIVSLIGFGVYQGSLIYISLCVSIAYWINFCVVFTILMRKGFEKSIFSFLLYFKEDALIYLILIFVSKFLTVTINNVMISFIVRLAVLGFLFILLLFVTNQWKYIKNIIKGNIHNGKR